MRLANFILVLLMPILIGCKILPSDEGRDRRQVEQTGPNSGSGIDESAAQVAAAGIRPKPRPMPVDTSKDAAISPVAPTEPEVLIPTAEKSLSQVKCEKQGGTWRNAGKSSAKTCIKPTRDAGKQCRKQGDCDSECLARSGTCAPVKPLFGCNEILQYDGRRVTLCVD